MEGLWETTIALSNGAIADPYDLPFPKWGSICPQYTVWVNPPTAVFWHFSQMVGNFVSIFTHLLYNPLYTRLLFFIQLFLTMTKLCPTKRDHLANFYISICFFTQQMKSLVTSYHIRHVYWHYKIVYFIVTCHRQRSTKLWTTYANVWTRTFRPIVHILAYYANSVVALNMAYYYGIPHIIVD